jgi:OOP family OmpA-OmpF porin
MIGEALRPVRILAILMVVLPLLSTTGAIAEDIAGSADHPLVPRYEGSEILAYETNAFDEFTLIAGPTRAADSDVIPPPIVSKRPIDLEGEITHLMYGAPEGRTALEVFRNYEGAIADAGFEILFSCSEEECGQGFNRVMNPDVQSDVLLYDTEQRYLAAQMSGEQGDVYLSLYVTEYDPTNRAYMKLDVIEIAPMEEAMTVVEASEMERGLDTDGSIAIYGILFDFDEATIRPDSKPQLDQIGELLTSRPELDVLIVGHTDAQGALDYNLGLSERRAANVVQALVQNYGIDASRLEPVGVGMAAPVASNRTEDGRALNRRVEIVELPEGS